MDNRVDFMNNGDLVIDTYNAIAEKYYKEFYHDFSDTKYIDKFLASLKGNKILDVGCGIGHLTNYMSEKDFCVVGIDLSDEMLKIVKRKYPDISFVKIDMRRVSFNQKYDGISLLYSLIHLTKDEVRCLLREYYDLLKDDGKMLIILQKGKGEEVVSEPLNNDLEMFVNYYSLDEVFELLKDSKLRVIYHDCCESEEGSLSHEKLVFLVEKIK